MAELPGPATGEQELLLVAYCNGNRCAGLRRLQTDKAAGEVAPEVQISSALELLQRAIRKRPRSLLLSTACLGHCDQAPMAALGWAVVADAGARWIGRPVGVGLLDRPGRIATLGRWIATTAPNLDSVPSLSPPPFR